MKFGLQDLTKLRWQILAALGLIGAAGLVANFGLETMHRAETAHRDAAARHNQAEARLRRASVEEEDIRERAALLVRLQEKGIFGAENRLDWTEHLRALQRRLDLPDMSYEFAPQKPLEGGGGDHAFFVSTMKLHLGLVHEGDLLAFVDQVQREARAVVLIRSCTLARPASAEPNAAPRLGADCELDWITVSKVEAKR